jgi:hypothetical protein
MAVNNGQTDCKQADKQNIDEFKVNLQLNDRNDNCHDPEPQNQVQSFNLGVQNYVQE